MRNPSGRIYKDTETGEKFHIEFKWGISRGRDTYGYNICTAYVDGKRVGTCNGGGYDMEGTSLSDWAQERVRPEDINTPAKLDKFYGVTVHKTLKSGRYKRLKSYRKGATITIDGACGLSSVLRASRLKAE